VERQEAGRGALARVVGIGASAGGVDALIQLVRHLPADLSAAVCVVLHVPATGRSLLASILDRHGDLPVVVAEHDAVLERGCVYVAPPDRHLTVADGRLRLDRGPKENGVRPAVDPMLRSLATGYGDRAVAVVLSGALGDGSGGALAVRQAGGAVIVQDPADAMVPSMPESALRAVGAADAVLPAEAIGAAIGRIDIGMPTMREDVVMTLRTDPIAEGPDRPMGAPSALSCPECRGPLWEVGDADLVRYRCRVGHRFSQESMLIEQGSAVEAALWTVLEALEERAEFLKGVAARHGDRRPRLRDHFEGAAGDALSRAELIRRALGAPEGRPHALDLQAEAAE
jgi:two-component system, chemotaxis family, protein-glutamate methylesterase/glutaminase